MKIFPKLAAFFLGVAASAGPLVCPEFPDPLDLRDAGVRGDTRLLRLTHYFRYVNAVYGTITVPTGFVTDGASIPKVFWPILGPQGQWFYAAIIHDFLYSKASNSHFKVTRWEADEIFLEAMTSLKVPWVKRVAIYQAVRMFGWTAFKKQ
jgi:hypothetical protein